MSCRGLFQFSTDVQESLVVVICSFSLFVAATEVSAWINKVVITAVDKKVDLDMAGEGKEYESDRSLGMAEHVFSSLRSKSVGFNFFGIVVLL